MHTRRCSSAPVVLNIVAQTLTIISSVSQENVLPLGSDFPVEDINPLLGFYAAVSRLSPAGDSPHGKGGW
jgi:predicted amidohydrolase YtcJ